MANAISNLIQHPATPTVAQQPVANATVAAKSAPPAQNATPVQAPAKAPAIQDTVKISSAAQSALQEAVETTVQTAQEARGGDHQAQRLLAKQAAAKKLG